MRNAARLFIACLLLLCFAGVARAKKEFADVFEFAIEGASLGMTKAEFARTSDIPITPAKNHKGKLIAYRAKTKKGFTGGGLFQVMFTREELGGKSYIVTLNRRWKVEYQDLDPLYSEFLKTYGQPDMFCLHQYDKHHVYHAYWGGKLENCSQAGNTLDVPHMYLNLVSGKWTELFVTLSDPGLLRENIELIKKTQ